jgi:hypothetical protein
MVGHARLHVRPPAPTPRRRARHAALSACPTVRRGAERLPDRPRRRSGNHDFIIHSAHDAPLPAGCPAGSWRSPMVEQQQLKRSLSLGFAAVGGDGRMRACGDDAATPIVPDGRMKVELGALEWRPDGMNHGRPAYQAHPAPAPVPEASGAAARQSVVPPALYILAGVAVGVACTVAVLRRAR